MIQGTNQKETTLTGTIANINNKYVVLNDKRFIEQSEIVNKLLPDDTINYVLTNTNTIRIISVTKREPQIVLGIIKSINTINQHIEIHCPGLPKFFSPCIPFLNTYKQGNALIIQIDQSSTNVLRVYESVQHRNNDKNMFLELYKLSASVCNLYPIYKYNSISHYTDDHQDLTHLDSFNVDPVGSKDFDDALSVGEDGRIYVHIVDAHEEIKPSTSVDVNAFLSSFTLYLPEHVENILPKEYAENRLSLIKNEPRKTITVEFTIDKETQNIISYEIYKSTIVIKNRYNYDEFNSIIYKFPELVSFHEKWKKNSMNVPHVKMQIDETTGKLSSYTFESNQDLAHKVIETFMILTNITISKHFPTTVPQRYHCKSDVEFVKENFFGNEIIDSIFTIKKYKRAIYDPTQEGHFGLGVNSYTHFTSPIRRYFDVVNHRLLSGIEYENLDDVLQHINHREKYIDKLVKLYENLKILSYLESDLTKVWKGYVINKTPSGLVVLLDGLLYEIFIFDKNYTYVVKDTVNVKIISIKWVTLDVKAIIV